MSFKNHKAPRPSEADIQKELGNLQTSQQLNALPGESLGSFTAQVRRPRTSNKGIQAQFYGENGSDADTIAALALSRFQDVLVEARVWGIKDHDGRLLSKNGQYPLLTRFIGRLERPQPSSSGMTAKIFCKNGPQADSSLTLAQSDLFDSLVYVELFAASEAEEHSPLGEVIPANEHELIQASERLTPTERRAFQVKQKRSQEAFKLLETYGFFYNLAVASSVGSTAEYFNWLTEQACSHPGDLPCDGHPVRAYALKDVRTGFQAIPLCEHHHELWGQGLAQETMPLHRPDEFFKLRQKSYLSRWVKLKLFKELRIPEQYAPAPSAIYDWALKHKVENALPSGFMAYIVAEKGNQ